MCDYRSVAIYSLNAQLLLKEGVCGGGVVGVDKPKDRNSMTTITSCAFYEGVGNEWLSRELFFTGHSDGKVNVSRSIP